MKLWMKLLLAAVSLPAAALAGTETLVPRRGEALVFFYRELAFQGNWFRYPVSEGGTSIGSLPAESFLACRVPAGEHTFRTGLLRHSATTLKLAPGRIYYLRCVPPEEVFYGAPTLQPVSTVEGAAVVATLRPGAPAH